jgi:hypothetical protein
VGSHQRFAPVASIAEYLKLQSGNAELRVLLSSYPLSCARFRTPAGGEILLALTIVTARGQPLEPGDYPFTSAEVHGGTAELPERSYVEPLVRLGDNAITLGPGGFVSLRSVDLGQSGRVTGILNLEHAHSKEARASRVAGAFEARLCRGAE